MSAEQFRRDIEQAVSQWLRNRRPDRGAAREPAGAQRLEREIDQAVDRWKRRTMAPASAPASASGPVDPNAPPAPAVSPFSASIGRRARPWSRRISICAWAYLALAIGWLGLLATVGESFPLTSWFWQGPRWAFLVPWLALLALALIARKRALAPLGLAMAVVWGPLLGGGIPWRLWLTFPEETPRLRLRALTCDKGSGTIAVSELHRLIVDRQLDLIALQNAPATADALRSQFPRWSVAAEGDLVVISRYPIREAKRIGDGDGDGDGDSATASALRFKGGALDCRIETPIGLARVINVRLRRSSSARDEASRRIASAIRDSAPPALILGSFGMTEDSPMFRRDWGRFRSAFSDAGSGLGYNASASWSGLRIDHVLGNRGWRFASHETGPPLGADHLPTLTEACWFAR